MKKIVGLGNCLVDILVQIDNADMLRELALPVGSMQIVDAARKQEIERRMAGQEAVRAPGGSAANTIRALARAGLETAFIGKVGDDTDGLFYADSMRQAGVNTMLAKSREGATGVANTFVLPDGQRTFATHLGVSGTLSPQDVTASMLEGCDTLYVEGYMVQNHQLMDHVMQMGRDRGMTICLDLASYNVVEQDREFFAHIIDNYTDIVFANEEESLALTGAAPDEALDMLASRCRVAVVKLGGQGSMAQRGDEKARVQAVKVERVIDTTGAGDHFAAGFLSAMAEGASLAGCLDRGGEFAARVIQVMGTEVTADGTTN